MIITVIIIYYSRRAKLSTDGALKIIIDVKLNLWLPTLVYIYIYIYTYIGKGLTTATILQNPIIRDNSRVYIIRE